MTAGIDACSARTRRHILYEHTMSSYLSIGPSHGVCGGEGELWMVPHLCIIEGAREMALKA